MKFYSRRYSGGDWDIMDEDSDGEWATRADAEQLEKELNAYRDECITRGGRELQALCAKEQAINERDAYKRLAQDMEECVDNVREALGLESTHFLVLHDAVREMRLKGEQAAKDAVEMAKLVQVHIQGMYVTLGHTTWEDDEDYKAAQTIIERYEGGKEI